MTSELDATKAVLGELAHHLDVDICIELWDGTIIPLGQGAQEEIRIVIGSPKVLRRLLLSPSLVSIAELYAAGDLDIVGGDPLEAFRHVDHLQFRSLPRRVNKARLLKAALPILTKSYSFNALANRFTKKIGRKSERDDRELIKFHYDISNDFYALFLDPKMVYSSAYFSSPDQPLEDAQTDKLDLICRKLRLEPGDRLWDPGCGWGGLLIHAVTHYGVTAHGTTLSQQQFDYVTAKLDGLGLKDKIKLELRDCRSLPADMIFDKISQVEMIEHIGIENHQDFYRTLGRHLRPRGVYFGQASMRRMTPNPDDFHKHSPYLDFSAKYIFPGGELDNIGMTCSSLESAGFEVHEAEAVREHFALTCEHWVKRIYARRQEAATMVTMPTTRLWLLFFTLCAASFNRSAMNAFQVVASKRQVGASGIAFDRRAEYGVKPIA